MARVALFSHGTLLGCNARWVAVTLHRERHPIMSKHSIKHLVLLISGTLLFSPASSLEAGERRFRLKIPNPFPRIVDGVEKVGDFVGRTAKKIVRNDDDDDDVRRRSGSASKQVRPPTEDIAAVPPGDLAQRPNPPVMRSPVTQPLPASTGNLPASSAEGRSSNEASKTLVASPSADRVAKKRTNDAATPADLQAVNGTMTTAASMADMASSDVAATSPDSAPSEPARPAFGRPVPGRPGLVYPPGSKPTPENRIDVSGISPGTKVRDPSTGQIFLVP